MRAAQERAAQIARLASERGTAVAKIQALQGETLRPGDAMPLLSDDGSSRVRRLRRAAGTADAADAELKISGLVQTRLAIFGSGMEADFISTPFNSNVAVSSAL